MHYRFNLVVYIASHTHEMFYDTLYCLQDAILHEANTYGGTNHTNTEMGRWGGYVGHFIN